MRLWSVHPQHLDVKGLVALWREGLLARKVLLGQTNGYRHHPQLERFQATDGHAIERMETYLHVVCDEGDRRKYRFDRTKLGGNRTDINCIDLTTGQLAFECEHLRKKLLQRTGVTLKPEHFEHHPMFVLVSGGKEQWERG